MHSRRCRPARFACRGGLAWAVMACAMALALAGDASRAAGQGAAPASAPAPASAASQPVGNISAKAIAALDTLLTPPQGATDAAWAAMIPDRCRQVIAAGERLAKAHPHAANLHEVYLRMLTAADALALPGVTVDVDKRMQWRRKVQSLVDAIASSDAPAGVRLQAEKMTFGNKVASMIGTELKAGLIKWVLRYRGTTAEAEALGYAAILAYDRNDTKLRDTFTRVLEKKHFARPGVRQMLRDAGKHPDVGRAFVAKLTKLDGTTLALPDDLKGKTVVVCFWASWVTDYDQDLVKLAKLRRQPGANDVVFVGVSLDRPGTRTQLQKYVATAGIAWEHTYSGLYDRDPTAIRYGVSEIPSYWVLGADGKVVVDGTDVDGLAEAIAKARKVRATSAPATGTVGRR